MEWSLGANLCYKVDLLRVDESLVLVGIVLLSNGDTRKGGTLLTQVGDNGTSVDARDSGNTLSGTPLAQALDSGPMTVLSRVIGNDDTTALDVG